MFPQDLSHATQVLLASTMILTSSTNVRHWYMDIGATHHLTLDASMLQDAKKYIGASSIILGNGLIIFITLFESYYLISATKALKLRNLLCVP